jgi:hypothetical protein
MSSDPETFPRLYDGPVRERRRPARETFQLAAEHPGRWIIDSASAGQTAAHNRAAYLRRQRPTVPLGLGKYVARYALERGTDGSRWIVLVCLQPESIGEGST